MAFGVDTSRSRLDLLPAIRGGGDFFVWNGNAAPLFAGRNFLAGDFIWAHAEATNASTEPDGAAYPLPGGAPSPEHPENLTLSVPRIAPIQGTFPPGPAPEPGHPEPPDPTHQRLAGDRGRLYGMIDADAICKRVASRILAGELALPVTRKMQVWLTVVPFQPFSDDYWAGWADTVNNYIVTVANGAVPVQVQPFRAAIICRYVAGADGRLRPEQHVLDALAVRHRGLNTTQHGFWADLTLWENAPRDLVANGNALLDWTRFDPPTAPILWRFAHGIEKPDGTPAGIACDVDATHPDAQPLAFMPTTQAWQPNVDTIQNIGFIKEVQITNVQAACLQRTPMPAMGDNGFGRPGHFQLPQAPIKFIGRYLRHGGGAGTITNAEAQMLSGADFKLFTVYESTRNLGGGMGPSSPTMQDVVAGPGIVHQCQHWGRFANNARKNIFYFRPDPDGNPATHDDAGTLDGTEAFQYVGDTLKQPPNTPVFFAIDFDPFDVPDASTVPAFPGAPAPEPADWAHNWPAPPALNVRKDWLRAYFTRIAAARDAYFARTERYYLIGVYAPGQALEVLYQQGVVSHFWQAASFGHSGSRPPRWPWFHANRWQYQGNVAAICAIGQPDPDADWGDGGLWTLSDPLAQDLDQFERLGVVFRFQNFDELVVPPPPPPPPP